MDFLRADDSIYYFGHGPVRVKYFNQFRGGWLCNIYYVMDSDSIDSVINDLAIIKLTSTRSLYIFKEFLMKY